MNRYLFHRCGGAIAIAQLDRTIGDERLSFALILFGGMDALNLAQKLLWYETRRFESRCEAVMWKITARGFTLQEVMILAAMNIATDVIAAEKRGQGASQNSTKEHTSTRLALN